jgi:hypothetical protein
MVWIKSKIAAMMSSPFAGPPAYHQPERERNTFLLDFSERGFLKRNGTRDWEARRNQISPPIRKRDAGRMVVIKNHLVDQDGPMTAVISNQELNPVALDVAVHVR